MKRKSLECMYILKLLSTCACLSNDWLHDYQCMLYLSIFVNIMTNVSAE